ncbi:hypothetical protein L1987_65005 [Smallanthus sonchifolius]|uniref:Uncharacterized protein n=1 Tax=Smallanthus sonchifolius TaxID=185202 RepID=A0ACB9BT96_9ASTR|nr:hypothetical protein L1987_65005 [Smallanthus sonchifolius]
MRKNEIMYTDVWREQGLQYKRVLEICRRYAFDDVFVAFAGDKNGGKITGQGTVSNDLITLEKVNFVSQLEFNLLSVSQVCDKDIPTFYCKGMLVLKACTGYSRINDYDACSKEVQHICVRVKSIAKKSYCLVITDEFSIISWVFFLATKDETPDTIIEFVKMIENICDSKVSIIHSDNGTEFKNQLINSFCVKKGITHQYSAVRTPQQNGVAERKNITLIEAARTMLVNSKLPIILWAEAVNTTCYVLNRVLMVKQLTKTSYELFYKRTPYIKFFRAFGCPCTLLNTQDSLPKFAAVGDECYFLVYPSYQKAYRVYNKKTKIVQESYYVE